MFTDDNSFQSQNCSTSRQTFIIESSISPTTFYTFLYSIFNQIHDIAKIKILSDKLKRVIFHRKKEFFQSFRLHQFIEMGEEKRDRFHNRYETFQRRIPTFNGLVKKKKENSVLSERKKHR